MAARGMSRPHLRDTDGHKKYESAIKSFVCKCKRFGKMLSTKLSE